MNHTPGPVTSRRSALPQIHSRNMLRLRCATLACTKELVANCVRERGACDERGGCVGFLEAGAEAGAVLGRMQ